MNPEKEKLGFRIRRRLTRELLPEMLQRLDALEAEVQECRQLNMRLAELTDMVEELVVPLASQDPERFAAALAAYEKGQ